MNQINDKVQQIISILNAVYDPGDGVLKTSAELGDVTIEDVGITSLPSGNLDQRGKVASLSVVPASDIPDATYVGDIKFGEALPAGTALLGKVGIDQVTSGANGVVTKTGSVTEATLSAETTKVIGTVNNKVANGDDVALGAKADAAATVGDTTPFSVIAMLKGIYNKLGAVVIAAGSNLIGKVAIDSTQLGASSSVSKTRPDNTTAYAANDVLGTDAATNMEFTSVFGTAAAEIIINRVELRIDASAVPSGMSSFKLHLYNAAPTAIADNTAYNLPSGDRAKYLGYIALDAPIDLGDTLYSNTIGCNFQTKLASASTTLYGLLTTDGAFTPNAQCVKTVTLHSLGV